jgi:hypothetical protein
MSTEAASPLAETTGHAPPAALRRLIGECGLSVVELMIATVLTVVGLGAIMTSCIRLHALQRVDTELGFAYQACRSHLEELRALPMSALAALDGTSFDVPGADGVTPLLQAEPGDVDRVPGEIHVRLERNVLGRSLYRIEVAVRWQSGGRSQSVSFETMRGGTP